MRATPRKLVAARRPQACWPCPPAGVTTTVVTTVVATGPEVAARSRSSPGGPSGCEKLGLDALVGVFDEQHPDFKFVNGAVAGGAGCDAKDRARLAPAGQRPAGHVPGPRRCRADRLHQRRPGRGPVGDCTTSSAWTRAVPGGPARPPDRRRQDLLDPVEHPPRQRRLGQPRGAQGRRARPGRDATTARRLVRRPGQVKAAGKTPLSVGDRLDPGAPARDRPAGRPGPDDYNGLWDGSTDWSGAEVTARSTTTRSS